MWSPAQDVRLALRVLWNKPGFTAVAVLTFGLGIATNTTVFGWINNVLLRPYGSESGDELVAIEGIGVDGDRLGNMTHPDFRAFQRGLTLASGVIASHPIFFAVGPEERPKRVLGEVISANPFEVLGVQPHLGRLLRSDEDRDDKGDYPDAVISYRLWKNYFRSDPSIVGKPQRVNGRQLTIVGVAPEWFSGTFGGVAMDVWVPISQIVEVGGVNTWAQSDYNARFFAVMARKKPGVTLDQLRAEVKAVATRTSESHPDTHRAIGATAVPMWQANFGLQSMLVNPLSVLMLVGVLVLVISCANVSNLLMARSVTRQREFALRLALGAGRLQLARQMLTEVLLLCGFGAIFGFVLAQWLGEGLYVLFPAADTAVREAVEPLMRSDLNWRVFAFTLLISIAAAVISTVLPALATNRVDVNQTLKDAGRTGSHGTTSRKARGFLVVSEVALAAMALVGAGLAIRSYTRASSAYPGFDSGKVLVSHLYLSTNGYSLDQEKQFDAKLKQRLEALPGIVSVSYANAVPLSHFSPGGDRVQVDSTDPRLSGVNWETNTVVSPGYLNSLRIPLIEGRDFNEDEDRTKPLVAIVNQSFARRYFKGLSVIGQRVRVAGNWCRIIGVVRDSYYQHIPEHNVPALYTAFRQQFWSGHNNFLFVRTSGELSRLPALIRREVANLGGTAGIVDSAPLTEYTKASLFAERISANLLGVLAALALLLAGVGLYSVMAYTVTERTQELGIRLALGAKPMQILTMVLKDGLLVTGAGFIAGLLAALAGAPVLLARLGLQLNNWEPQVLAAAALPLLSIASFASLIPALRATRVDPGQSLRAE